MNSSGTNWNVRVLSYCKILLYALKIILIDTFLSSNKVLQMEFNSIRRSSVRLYSMNNVRLGFHRIKYMVILN